MLSQAVFLFALFAAISASLIPPPVPFGSPFAGYQKSYYVSATYLQAVSAPSAGLVSQSSFSGVIGNDPVNQRAAVDLGAFKTYILPNITYNVINGPAGPVACLKVTNYTYAFEVASKAAAFNTELEYIVDPAEDTDGSTRLVYVNHYFGFVNDPGAGLNVRISYDAYVSILTGLTRRVKFAQNLPSQRNPDGSCNPATLRLVGIINLDDDSGVAPAGFYTPPAALCANAVEYAEAECL